MNITDDMSNNPIRDTGKTIGDSVVIRFSSLGDTEANGKVDTGATTSSMHAINIQPHGDQVTFICPHISNNAITMALDGTQDVSSADGGNNSRPIVRLDVNVDGIDLQGVSFNLNDRSEMDCPILIGQNIIKAGGFIIDLNKEDNKESVRESIIEEKKDNKETTRTTDIMGAIKILKDNNVTIFELVEFLRTAPLYLRNGDEYDHD